MVLAAASGRGPANPSYSLLDVWVVLGGLLIASAAVLAAAWRRHVDVCVAVAHGISRDIAWSRARCSPVCRSMANCSVVASSSVIFLGYDSTDRRTCRPPAPRCPRRKGLDPGAAGLRAWNQPERHRPDGTRQAEPQPPDDRAAWSRSSGEPSSKWANPQMTHLRVEGGRTLSGAVDVNSSKNAGVALLVRQPDQPRHHHPAPPGPDRGSQPDRRGLDRPSVLNAPGSTATICASAARDPGPGIHGRGCGPPHPQRHHAARPLAG